MLNVLSSTLQFIATVILMLWCLKGTSKNKIIIKYFQGDNWIHKDDDDNCVLEQERLHRTAKNVYLNVYALFLLSVGYLISFSDLTIVTDMTTYQLAGAIILCGYMAGDAVTDIIALTVFNSDIIIKYEDLSKIVNVNTNMNDKDIDSLFD